MQYLGDFAEDATVYIPFNTFSSNDPQASVTATTLIASDIKVHKDGSVTDIVTDGATIAIDFDTITGNHLITIDTSASADYSTGSDYLVRIEGATVDAGNINAIVGSFSIENRFNDVNVVTVSGTAQTANDNGADINTLLTRIVGTLAAGTHNPASAAQIAVLSDWINAGRLDTILDTINSATGGLAGAAMRGTDGANTTVPDAAGVAPTAVEIRQEMDTNSVDLNSILTNIAALNDISVADILTTQMTESYAADGVAPTLAQAIFMVQQSIGDFSISGTTITQYKLDGTTTAATYLLDSATVPTSRTRSS